MNTALTFSVLISALVLSSASDAQTSLRFDSISEAEADASLAGSSCDVTLTTDAPRLHRSKDWSGYVVRLCAQEPDLSEVIMVWVSQSNTDIIVPARLDGRPFLPTAPNGTPVSGWLDSPRTDARVRDLDLVMLQPVIRRRFGESLANCWAVRRPNQEAPLSTGYCVTLGDVVQSDSLRITARTTDGQVFIFEMPTAPVNINRR